MAWSLKTSKKSIVWRKRRIFGREDFPDEPAFSRKHFEVIDQNGRVFVQDLKSTNGTFIYGQKVKVGEAIEIQLGDKVKVGETAFELKAAEDFAPVWIDLALFVPLMVATFAEPSYAWGRSVGVMGFLLITALLLISFVTVASASNFIMVRILNKLWTKKTYGFHAAAVLVLTLILHYLLLGYADRHWKVGDDFIQAKIEYFCVDNFNQPMCVKHVNICESCTMQLEKWKRDLVVEKLKAFRAPSKPEARQPAAAK